MSKKGEGEDGNEGDDHRRISPQHPSPILHAPRDNISCKGKSLTPRYRSCKETVGIPIDPYGSLPTIP